MSSFVITTDSCSDLSQKFIKENEIKIVNLTVNVEGVEYDGRINKITAKEIYDFMRKGRVPVTSQANPKRLEKFFEKYLKDGQDIVHICLSGQLSGTYNSSKIAANELKEKYPERRIKVIDSLSGSLGEGLLVLEAVKEKNKGKNIDEVTKIIENKRYKMCNMFIVDDLGHLKRSGRISKTESVIGAIIGVKPILTADNDGKIIQIAKVRGRKNAMICMLEKMKEIFDLTLNQVLAIGHSDCLKDAKLIKEMINERFNIKNIIIGEIGPVMGVHCGPGALAIFFMAKNRFNKK